MSHQIQCLKTASIDSTIKVDEAPIIKTELEMDPAAPVSGFRANADNGNRSWSEALAATRKGVTTKTVTRTKDEEGGNK